jgi:hypothetical protein
MTDKTIQMDGAKLRPDQIDVLSYVYKKLRVLSGIPASPDDLADELELAFPTLEKWYQDTKEDE